ncbi:gliding motility lipoprotein GldH [Flavobacterium sp. Sd200]|uniref:gliding motility lipoprotein GldH n=1 Tax=Flavobacterium sp. Sd200 TaxID=2692211 RepID=UPI0013684B0E|nr:gliding motility lipoprotein GldH [Flavobacterium sp. Sd200]
MIKSSFLALGLLFLFCSCDKARVFDEYKELNGSWDKDSIVSFTFAQKDTVSKYDLFVTMRNNNSFPYSNIYLIVQMEEPASKIVKVDTLEYQMANPDGTLMGKGFSDIKESKLWYKEKVRFPKVGNYTVKIQQAVRQAGQVPGVQELEGVTEVGFRIESTE